MNKSINTAAVFTLVSTSIVCAQTGIDRLPEPAAYTESLSAPEAVNPISNLWSNIKSRSWRTEKPEPIVNSPSLPTPSTATYVEDLGWSDVVDYRPNFLLTETSVRDSWIRLDYRYAFGGSDELVFGSQFDQSNIVLRGEYAINNDFAITGEYGYQDLGSPVDSIFDSGTIAPKIGLKFDVYERGGYEGTIYFSRIMNESADARYSEIKENGVEFGFTNTYVMPSKRLTLVLDFSISIAEYDTGGGIEDLKEVDINFGAYKEITDRWGVGMELGYYDFDGAGFTGDTTLLRTNIFANYAVSNKLDATLGYNINPGTTDGYTGTIKQQIVLGATYTF